MSEHDPVEIDGVTGEISDYTPVVKRHKPLRYRSKLQTLSDVKNEMAKVYREARSGLIDNSEATKQVWMLKEIGKIITDSELELRMDRLEARHETN